MQWLPEFKGGGEARYVDTIPADMMALDIGPKTVDLFSKAIAASKTIIWNGPMGVFELPPYDMGTVAVAKAVAESGAVSVVGGGDSEKAIKTAGVSAKITACFHWRRSVISNFSLASNYPVLRR